MLRLDLGYMVKFMWFCLLYVCLYVYVCVHVLRACAHAWSGRPTHLNSIERHLGEADAKLHLLVVALVLQRAEFRTDLPVEPLPPRVRRHLGARLWSMCETHTHTRTDRPRLPHKDTQTHTRTHIQTYSTFTQKTFEHSHTVTTPECVPCALCGIALALSGGARLGRARAAAPQTVGGGLRARVYRGGSSGR